MFKPQCLQQTWSSLPTRVTRRSSATLKLARTWATLSADGNSASVVAKVKKDAKDATARTTGIREPTIIGMTRMILPTVISPSAALPA